MSSYTVLAYPAKSLPEKYLGLIYSKWLRSLRHGNDYFKYIDAGSYYRAYHRYIENVMHDPRATVRIAVLTDDKDVALGFSISREKILDYVHVQADQRGHGIARNLVPKDIDTVTHLTRTGLTIWADKFKHWKFNPFV